MSPKKWISLNSSRYLKQYVLSQPWGKTCYKHLARIMNMMLIFQTRLLIVAFKNHHKLVNMALTSKLICPPIENVRLRWANFSRSTDTIFGRMFWTWGLNLFSISALTSTIQRVQNMNPIASNNICFVQILTQAFSYLVILFKFISFFLAAVPSNWWYIKHPTSEFYKCSPLEIIGKLV